MGEREGVEGGGDIVTMITIQNGGQEGVSAVLVLRSRGERREARRGGWIPA